MRTIWLLLVHGQGLNLIPKINISLLITLLGYNVHHTTDIKNHHSCQIQLGYHHLNNTPRSLWCICTTVAIYSGLSKIDWRCWGITYFHHRVLQLDKALWKPCICKEVLKVRKKDHCYLRQIELLNTTKMWSQWTRFPLDGMQNRITTLGPQIGMCLELPESSYNFTLDPQIGLDPQLGYRLMHSWYVLLRETYDGKS